LKLWDQLETLSNFVLTESYDPVNINKIRELVSLHKLTEANRDLDIILRSTEFSNLVQSFYNKTLPPLSHLGEVSKRFTMIIYDHSLDRPYEPDYFCYLSDKRFLHTVFSFSEFIHHFLHSLIHLQCAELWRQIFIPRDKFNEAELDFFEEMYGQALVYQYFPQLYNCFLDHMYKFLDYRKLHLGPLGAEALSLYSLKANISEPSMARLHAWLYGQKDLLDKNTFFVFMRYALHSLEIPRLKSVMEERALF
jgi:hypothetical protein